MAKENGHATNANLEAFNNYAMRDDNNDIFSNDVSGCHYIEL